MPTTIIKKLYLAGLLLVVSLPGALAQVTITGFTPVIGGVNYGPYTISGLQWSTADHWCVTGGTLNNTSNTCMNDDGTPSVSVTWTSSGTLSYYQGAMTTPVATYTVTVYPVSNTVDQSNAEFAPNYYPFVPLNQLYTINLTGSAVSVPPGTVTYSWQESLDGTNYTVPLSNANSQNFSLSQVFTQTTTWIRRYVFVSLLGRNYSYYSNQIMVNAVPPVQAGTITPTLLTSTSGTTYFTVTPATGGSMCGPGNYTYTWQTSRDNLNWTNVGSGLTYTPGTMAFNDYVRVLAYCGPIAGISNVAYLQNVINNGPLQGGTISPMSIMIASGTGPGNLTGNPASGGNTGPTGYVYNWQYSADGINFSSFSTPVQTLNYNPGNLSSTTYFRRQVSCADGEQAVSNIAQINVGTAVPYNNYIRSNAVTAGGITSMSAADALSALSDVKQTTAYFDGLGRPTQTVAKQGSLATGSAATDMVLPVQYDLTGKQVFDYLPYVSTGSDGTFKRNALPEQNAFNATLFNGQGEHFYYGQTNYEPSPLARINSSSAPGDSWAGSNKNTQHLYLSNTVTDQVMIWNVTNSATPGVFGSYSSNTGYAAGSLYKNVSKDENGNQVIEFKDFKGNMVLKKVQLSGTSDDGTGTGYTGWLCTYYIYDDWNNLRCVVQPHGVELLIQNGWNIAALSNVILNEQCFRYEYDQRSRMVMKQVPGAGPVYTVYDNLDRVVMTQDAHLRATTGQWLTTLYETSLDRPVATGLFTTASTFASLLTAAAASTSYPFPLAGAPAYPAWELLTLTHYDDYTGIPSGISGTLNLSAINMANFYSSYNTSPVYAQPLTQSTPATAVNIKGLVTWTQKEVLGSGGTQYISMANLYDTRAQIIQEQILNYSGGLDIATTQYNFIGKPLITDLRHQKLTTGGPTQVYEEVSRNSYDALERPVMVEKMLITSLIPSPAWKTLSTVSYDALGRLTTKTVGNNPANTGSSYVPLETQAYEYNIRNWLLGVNRNFINSSTSTNYFGFELGYDKASTIVPATTYAIQQFNGNIGGTVWKNGGDAAVRKYDFSYDAVNRLLKADFNQYNSSFNKNDGLNFSVTGLGYDANGNITAMTQMGWNGSGSTTPIDQLTYTPVLNTNRLQNVMDTYSDQNTTLGDFRYSTKYTAALAGSKTAATVDYSYDANGNLTADKNKDITSITYNYLNLPASITIAGQTAAGTITYIYDAAGNKLVKIVNEPNGTAGGVTGTTITTTTTYIAGFEYKSLQYGSSSLASLQFKDNLQSFWQEEGRVRALYTNASSPTAMTGFAFDYFLKDHLGNTRSVITEEAETDAYPTLTFEGATSADVANQNAIWDNTSGQSINVLSSRISPLPVGFSASTNGSYCGSVTKAQGAIGAAKLIRVMARDQLNVSIDYTYSSATVDNTSANGLNTLLNSLAAMILGSGQVSQALEPQTMAGTFAANQNNTTVSNFLSVANQEVPGTPGGPPKAYLHVLLFNDQFVFDNVNSVVVPVTSAGLNVRKTLTEPLTIPKNGYAYIYFSNESNTVVYFDNFALTHVRGPLLETNDYYPFGLTMAGISDKVLKMQYAENKYRFNKGSELQNKEFSDGSGLEMYETHYRMLDPQLGRFWQIDPKPDYAQSLYSSMGNNPISFNDPLGDTLLNKADQRQANRITKNINSTNKSLSNQATKLNGQIAKADAKGNTSKADGLRAKLGDVNGRIATNNGSLAHLNAIVNDQTQAYTFNQLPAGSTIGGTTMQSMNVNGNNQNVVVMGVTSDVNAVHEMTHAFQGGIEHSIILNQQGAAFPGANLFAQQMTNAVSENQAYQAQYALDPSSMPPSTGGYVPNNLNSINAFYVGGIIQPGTTTPVYPNVQNMVNTIIQFIGIF